MKRPQGFSLTEVMIGLFILALVVGGFLLSLRSARKEVEFSDKHVSVLLCSQKVVEDLMEEIWLNPSGFQTLGIDTRNPTPSPITDGQSVFFTGLEAGGGTSAAPRQEVIAPSMEPLYHQVDDLELKVAAERQAPVSENRPESNLYLGDISFAWDSPRGKGEGALKAVFFSPSTPKNFTPGSFASGGAGDASYTEILGSPGGQVEVLRNLADVYRACRAFIQSEFFTRTLREIKDLKRVSRNCSFPSKALYDCHFKLAGLWYELARRSLNFLISVEPAMTAFSKGYSPGSLGGAFGTRPRRLNSILRDFRLIYETLVSSLLQARANYQFLVSPALAKYRGMRLQFHLILRVLDLYRVLLITPTYRYGLVEYRRFLKDLDAFGTGRSPALRRLVAYELANSGTVGQVVDHLPNLKMLDTLFGQKMRPVLGFVRQNVSGPE